MLSLIYKRSITRLQFYLEIMKAIGQLGCDIKIKLIRILLKKKNSIPLK